MDQLLLRRRLERIAANLRHPIMAPVDAGATDYEIGARRVQAELAAMELESIASLLRVEAECERQEAIMTAHEHRIAQVPRRAA